MNHAIDSARLMLRGGSWAGTALIVRSAYRVGDISTYQSNHLGFRLAQDKN